MGSMGLSLIKCVYALILGVGVESRHVRQFGELDRARRTTLRFAKSPLIAFNFMLKLSLGSVTYGEMHEFVECTWRLVDRLS
ncbi:hypothetical protein H5410_031123 [Solanum commersonii]|uniref:Uncharacterized protein n=1 Tax=Solanum commersonii TaxID=4109 RepID=A0A9J5YHK7_SOLCO|nr:hypothetical protein H5410_031123 [Solanum commersonii]